MERIALAVEDIHQLAQNIWDMMFGGGLEVAENEPAGGAAFLTGSIQITGAWEGVVALRVSLDLARELACSMLAIEDPQETDLCDAIGELANLTAGAVQPLLPTPTELTPPTVIEGRDYKLVFPRCSIVNEAAFGFRSQPLTITLFEANHDRCQRHPAETECSFGG